MKFLAELFADSTDPEASSSSPAGAGPDTPPATPDTSIDRDPKPEQDNLDAITDKASQDPDYQGVIRKVKGAHLVYKRETEEGTYEELWLYNIDDIKTDLSTRKAILAGTDIPVHKIESEDRSQSYKLWSIGNVEMVIIKGLPN